MGKVEGKHYVDASKVSVAPIAKSIAKDMIIKKHYTHAWTACRYALGIYHTMDEKDIFGNDQELVGVAVYGFPVGAKASTSVCEGLTKDNILELTRLYVDDGFGSNIESCALGKTFQWLKDNVDENTLFVSVMTVNNETGMRSNIEEINEICKNYDVIFHSDMAQALHGEKFDLAKSQIDAISISGHKIHGPKGVGALILNHEPREFLSPISHGGLQEQEIRSGTVPVFLTVGLSQALHLIQNEHEQNKKYLLDIRQTFMSEIKELSPDIKINYASNNGHPGTINLHFKNIDADIIATRLANDVAVSTAAACNGVGFEYSYVLKNMHLDDEISKSSIRLCFSKYNTFDEAKKAANLMYEKYKQS